uniref:Transposase n=1 Tax=Sphingobium baderi TaxID=1332080 RepID=A0A144J3H9_9SPHN|nr:transposase [Sphingobium baderi]
MRKCWRNAAFRSTIRRSIAGSSATPRRWRSGCAGSGGVALIRAGAWMKPTSRCGQVDLPVPGSRQAGRHDRFLPVAAPQRQGSEAVPGQGPARPEALGKPATLNTDKAPSYSAAITELKREGKLDRETAHRQVKYLNNVIEADHGKLKILIKPVRGFKSIPRPMPRSRDSKSCEPCAKDRLAPGACSPASGARCALWRELLALGPRADGGHGHAQPPFRSSRLIGAERQPTSDCRQSLQQSPTTAFKKVG